MLKADWCQQNAPLGVTSCHLCAAGRSGRSTAEHVESWLVSAKCPIRCDQLSSVCCRRRWSGCWRTCFPPPWWRLRLEKGAVRWTVWWPSWAASWLTTIPLPTRAGRRVQDMVSDCHRISLSQEWVVLMGLFHLCDSAFSGALIMLFQLFWLCLFSCFDNAFSVVLIMPFVLTMLFQLFWLCLFSCFDSAFSVVLTVLFQLFWWCRVVA